MRADVLSLRSLSVHADADDLTAWIHRLPRRPETVFVVHGEPEASEAFADRLGEDGYCAVVPRQFERVRLP